MIIDDLKCKAECYYGKTSSRHVLQVLLTDGTSAVVLYRLAKFFQKIGLGVIGWFLLEINKLLHGCVIGRSVEFGKGFVLMHPIGVIINGAVKGGEKVVIESGVVIGASRNGLPVQVPVLGNNIFIGAGAKVLGRIHVGNNVKIGANAVVVKDVPDNVTVAGIPARIISQHHSSPPSASSCQLSAVSKMNGQTADSRQRTAKRKLDDIYPRSFALASIIIVYSYCLYHQVILVVLYRLKKSIWKFFRVYG
jgi:serine O-acetyltransferase